METSPSSVTIPYTGQEQAGAMSRVRKNCIVYFIRGEGGGEGEGRFVRGFGDGKGGDRKEVAGR